MPSRYSTRPVARALGLGSMLLLATACALGPRPTLGPPTASTTPSPTGDTRVDQLLSRLDAVPTIQFTATFRLTRLLGNLTTEARVVSLPPSTSITIGEVRFFKGNASRTCSTTTQKCDNGLLDQRLGNFAAMTNGFYASTPSQQIRVSFRRRTSEVTFSTRAVAGLSTNCITIPLGTGDEIYCVAPNGPVAFVQRADTTTELLTWSAVATAAEVTPPA